VIVYFDTSALLKRYVAETDSDAVTALWKNASMMAASLILYAEVAAAFRSPTSRAARERHRARSGAANVS
jgi:predicted nucleic acid-binding protein